MPLELHPLTPDDIPHLVRIQNSAFPPGTLVSKLRPHPPPPTYTQSAINKNHHSLLTEPDVHYLKIIDTSLPPPEDGSNSNNNNNMIAAAKWRINLQERGPEEVARMMPQPGPDEQGNEAAGELMRYLRWARGTYMGGKPFYFLHMLVTDPEHHRRGAGAMLVEWGTAQANASNLPCFLEATETGRPLYTRLGFEPVHEEVFDLEKWGGVGRETNTVMIRLPVGSGQQKSL